MPDPTPLQQAMLSELAEYVDPAGLQASGRIGVRAGNHQAVGIITPAAFDGTRLDVDLWFVLYPDAPMTGEVDARTAAEWLGAG